MLDKKTAKLINEQVTLEFYSAYLYLDFANFYTDQGLDGFAHWFEIQAQEERDHAMLMRTYLQNNNVHVEFGTINKPEGKYKDLMSPLTEGKVRRKEVLLGVCAKGPLLSSFSQKDKKYFSFEAKNHELTYDIMEDTIIRIENQGKC